MIVPAKMKHTMDQQYCQFIVDRSSSLPSLPKSSRQGDDHIPQQIRSGALTLGQYGFPYWKCQHISHSILFAIFTIQSPYASIPYQFQTQFRLRFSDRHQDTLSEMFKGRLSDGVPHKAHPEIHRHY
jgi:hypothetical protein